MSGRGTPDPVVTPSGFFVLRTPLLPFAEVTAWGDGLQAPAAAGGPGGLGEAVATDRAQLRRRLEDIVTTPEFRDALFVASPHLAAAVDLWRKEPDSDKGRATERSLVSYVLRAAARPTPFGLFAGCTTGIIGERTCLRLDGGAGYRRSTRLDMDYLWALAEAVERDPRLRGELDYRPNSSLYQVGDRLLFAEAGQGRSGRSYRLVAVGATPYLMQTLARARDGARLDTLAAALVDDDITRADADEYIAELAGSQVLVADVRPQWCPWAPRPRVMVPARAAKGDVLPAMPDSPAATASRRRRPAPLRLMAVHAHPDDESSKGAATMARYVRCGVDVMVCTLTGGERGDILNKAMDRPEIRANLSRVRREEMARAREILGIRQQFLGFVDSGLPEGDPLPPLPEGCFALQKLEDATEPLVRAVREFRPHVMVTYDENGGYPHPDHVMTHQVSVEAFDAAADPDRYPGSGEPWQPLKLYYFVSWFTALHEEMERRELESPYTEWFKRWGDEDRAATRPQLKITTRVPCADFFAVRDQALLAHATQIDPESSWFACPVEVQQAAWPTEDYHLARSVVDTELPEDDLFAGVREMLLVSAAGIPVGQAR